MTTKTPCSDCSVTPCACWYRLADQPLPEAADVNDDAPQPQSQEPTMTAPDRNTLSAALRDLTQIAAFPISHMQREPLDIVGFHAALQVLGKKPEAVDHTVVRDLAQVLHDLAYCRRPGQSRDWRADADRDLFYKTVASIYASMNTTCETCGGALELMGATGKACPACAAAEEDLLDAEVASNTTNRRGW